MRATFRVLIRGILPVRETACAHGDTWLKQGSGTTEIASRELAELVHLPAFYHVATETD